MRLAVCLSLKAGLPVVQSCLFGWHSRRGRYPASRISTSNLLPDLLCAENQKRRVRQAWRVHEGNCAQVQSVSQGESWCSPVFVSLQTTRARGGGCRGTRPEVLRFVTSPVFADMLVQKSLDPHKHVYIGRSAHRPLLAPRAINDTAIFAIGLPEQLEYDLSRWRLVVLAEVPVTSLPMERDGGPSACPCTDRLRMVGDACFS